jgi:outer membrane protein
LHEGEATCDETFGRLDPTLVKPAIVVVLTSAIVGLSGFRPILAAEQGLSLPRMDYAPEKVKQTYTLREAVDVAVRNFPTIANRRFKLYAASANVTLAKTAYLPNFDMDVQEMLTTHNVVTSTVLGQANNLDAIPIQSGTPSQSVSMSPIWASNQVANFNWLLYDFGYRKANVALARADAKLAQDNLRLTQLDVAYEAASKYLEACAAQQTILAAEAALDRMRAAEVEIKTMVDQGMRPGVDAARADYDVSDAKILVIQAQRATELAKVDLAEKMGIAGANIDIVSDPVVHGPTRKMFIGATNFDAHPLAQVGLSAVGTWAARVHVLDRAWRPHIWWNSAIIGRGSGYRRNQVEPVAGGFLPQVPDWVAGMQVSFPIMDYFAIKAERKAALANEYAEKADFDLAIQVLEQKDARARVLLSEARKIADETPRLVASAKENEIKQLERYKAGLTNMVTLAEAERLLAKAEVDDALAQIDVWRSILALGYVQGNLKPFMDLVAYAEGGTPQ